MINPIKTYSLKKNSISTIYSTRDFIDSQPEYQRHGGLWTIDNQKLFIDM